MTDAAAPTERFSNRVGDYVRHRPGYPPGLVAWLRDDQGIGADQRVVDIGAGTGISTRMWRQAGHDVVAVEPNAAMREAGQAASAGDPGVRWMDGSAEATGLADASVDVVSAAQAFHWFDPAPTRREWIRILRPDGLAVLLWNLRAAGRSALVADYEALQVAHGIDYVQVADRHPDDAAIARWYGGGLRATASFPHTQPLDFDGLLGRLLSSSWAPQSGHPKHAAMVEALRALFERHAVDGRVAFDYDARVFVGTLPPNPPSR